MYHCSYIIAIYKLFKVTESVHIKTTTGKLFSLHMVVAVRSITFNPLS